jgi:AAA15 family ATPase/GTPase
MGDGMNRLLGITLALATARDGILLVDEIENGIHYSVQVDVWRAILHAAESLNVQVFATTHSWDCIRAFAAAASEFPNVYGMLHRLEPSGDGNIATVGIGEEDLALIARQRIEVR